MLTVLAMLAGPIVLTTVLVIAVFEIRDILDRNHLR